MELSTKDLSSWNILFLLICCSERWEEVLKEKKYMAVQGGLG